MPETCICNQIRSMVSMHLWVGGSPASGLELPFKSSWSSPWHLPPVLPCSLHNCLPVCLARPAAALPYRPALQPPQTRVRMSQLQSRVLIDSP